jgi:MFS family permease
MSTAAIARSAVGRLDTVLGGAARRRVIVTLAAVLALDTADATTVGTNATQLEQALHIGKPEIGLLLTVSNAVGALAAVPFGVLVDRTVRTRLLALAIVVWAAAMAASGAATSFLFLLLTRVALGAVVAVAGPAVASLVGDFFDDNERGRIYGFIISGELVGAGFGFVVAGQLASWSWRAPFVFLVLPSLAVAWIVHRMPEPERGGAGRLPSEGPRIDSDSTSVAYRITREQDVQPATHAILEADAAQLPLRQAVRYVLAVRTNVVLIVASALGYFFFSGMRGFAVQFAKEHYGVGQHEASLLTVTLGAGALAGVLVGGRLADRLLRNGRLPARTEVAGVAALLSTVLFVPALVVTSVWLAVPLLTAAALCLGAVSPPLDAARLDIIHPAMWGRAESVRTVLRTCGDAVAPLLFGVMSASVFGGSTGLEYTFLSMLGTVVAAALITLLIARRTYPHDVAAVARSLAPAADSH